MPLLVTATQPISKLDVGSYTVTCTGAVESVMTNSQFDNPDIYRFFFDVHDVTDEDGEQATIDAICSRKLSPSSKLWKFLTAFGIRPEVGKTFDLEDCIGKTVVASVEPNKAGTYNNVANLYPLPKGSAKATSQKAQEAPSEARAPWEGDVVDADTVSAWWKDILGQGFERKAIVDLSKEMFERLPGELNADELKGLNDQLLATA